MKTKADEPKKKLGDILGAVEITPLKDFPSGIHHNQYHFDIKEGVPVTLPRKFLQNMVTEGVIKKLPEEG